MPRDAQPADKDAESMGYRENNWNIYAGVPRISGQIDTVSPENATKSRISRCANGLMGELLAPAAPGQNTIVAAGAKPAARNEENYYELARHMSRRPSCRRSHRYLRQHPGSCSSTVADSRGRACTPVSALRL